MGEAAKKRDDTKPRIWPDWMLTDVAAEYCEMSANTIRKHVASGDLVPDSRGGTGRFRSHRFRRATLDRWLEGKQANDNGKR